MTRPKRPGLLTLIAILTLFGGVWGVFQSFPFYNISTALYRGGIPNENTVTISLVEPNSPAFNSGLKVNDKIISVNGQAIHTTEQFITLTHQNLGKPLSITVLRGNEQQTIQTIAATPRTTFSPTEGPLGVVIVGSGVIKEQTSQLILDTIVRSYAGQEERMLPSLGSPVFRNLSTVLHQSTPYYDKSLGRLKELLLGVLSILIGIGLLALKRWAYFGFMLLAGVSILFAGFTIFGTILNTGDRVSIALTLGMSGIYSVPILAFITAVIEFFFAWYIYSCRKLFN